MKNKDPKRKHKSLLGLLKWWIIGFAFLLLVLASLVVRLPYYLEMPGGAYDIRSVLKVNKKADKAKGSYNFVAVSVSQATPAQVLYAWLTPFTESVGKVIKLSNGKNGIGIGLTDHTEVSSDVPVDFNTEGVGGPSAGLMFTLAIYDQLVKEDLRKGRKIAGTGTIEQNGHVGDIGGAGLKVVSAAKKGMDIFFVPNNPIDKNAKKGKTKVQTNYQEAKAAAKRLGTKMKIVPVQNVQQAIDYLKKTK